MVMHARKPQRMNDGYFEKHQAHPYQNSKYSSSKSSYGSSGERYERIRDSPNGNSYRSDSPDSQSPRDRDRSYQSKSSYLQKIREKERENRDYKMSRDKYSDCARSPPKDKRNRECRDSEHRTNHDRSLDDKLLFKMTSQNSSRERKPMHNCQDKREDRERLTRVGDWSEHISSSGKKYYYNCKTEVSQWEKPREWVEREHRDRDRFSSSSRSKESRSSSSSSTTLSHDKPHSNSRGSVKRHWRDEIDVAAQHHHDPRRKHIANDADSIQSSTQDMDISPGDSTPTSEISYVHTPSTSSREHMQLSSSTPAVVGEDISHPVLLANALPRLQQQPSAAATTTVAAVLKSPVSIELPTMVPPPTAGVTSCNTPGPPSSGHQMSSLAANLPRILSQMVQTSAQQPMDVDVSANGDAALIVSSKLTEHGIVGEGPPTPTHSETQDCCLDPRKQLLSPSSVAASTTSASNSSTSLHVSTSTLSALRPQGPCITPSLANYHRDDLVNHVRGWPADILEKQAQKLSDEAHVMGSLQCTKVSAELKSARSIVRLTEIQATLQEQRILFLRQQIKMLEDLKSQNSFMSDDV